MGASLSCEKAPDCRECHMDPDFSSVVGFDRCCGQPVWDPSALKQKSAASKLRIIKSNSAGGSTADQTFVLYSSHQTKHQAALNAIPPIAIRKCPIDASSQFDSLLMDSTHDNLAPTITKKLPVPSTTGPKFQVHDASLVASSTFLKAHCFGAKRKESHESVGIIETDEDFRNNTDSRRNSACPANSKFPSEDCFCTPPRNDFHGNYYRPQDWTPDSAISRYKHFRHCGFEVKICDNSAHCGATEDCPPHPPPQSAPVADPPPPPPQSYTPGTQPHERPTSAAVAQLLGLHGPGYASPKYASPKYVSSRPSPKSSGSRLFFGGGAPAAPLAPRRLNVAAALAAGSPQAQYVSSRPSWQAFPAGGKEN